MCDVIDVGVVFRVCSEIVVDVGLLFARDCRIGWFGECGFELSFGLSAWLWLLLLVVSGWHGLGSSLQQTLCVLVSTALS